MNIYKISQTQNLRYDTFDAAIVAASSEDEARHMHPNDTPESERLPGYQSPWVDKYEDTWCKSPELVTVELLGRAVDGCRAGVLLASFNAG